MEFSSTGEITLAIEITDIDGKVFYKTDLAISKGNSNTHIPLHFISSGKYFLKFYAPFNPIITKQFIIRN